jgi:hypothetical protein
MFHTIKQSVTQTRFRFESVDSALFVAAGPRYPLNTHSTASGSEGRQYTGGLNTHYTAIKNTEGIRITPCDFMEMICLQ